MKGNAYLQLPEKLKGSCHILNIQNRDEKCAIWCILAHLHPKYRQEGERRYRIQDAEEYYIYEDDINTLGIEFPLKIPDVSTLETINNLNINIFSFDKLFRIIPIRISEQHNVPPARHIDLLYIVNSTQSHYCLITNLESLCRKQVTSHKGDSILCRRCLHFCTSKKSFDRHTELCIKHIPQRTWFPQKNDPSGRDKAKFTHTERQLPLPFYFVADFECILEKYDTCPPDPSQSNTTSLNRHIVCGAAYSINSIDPRFYRLPRIFTREEEGKSITEQFLDSILKDAQDIRQVIRREVVMEDLTDEQLNDYHSIDAICHICKTRITEVDIRCRDHCHITGCYRGPTHQRCNLNYSINKENIQIPCFFHNLKSYDAHLLISAAQTHHGDIKVIPTTTEKYISFTIGDITFKDSYAFTQASLDTLVNTLTLDQFINTRKWLDHWHISQEESDRIDSVAITSYQDTPYQQPILTIEQRKQVETDLMLLKCKGIYPYEYMDSLERFKETMLPPIDAFRSQLHAGKGITIDEYSHANEVFSHFQMKTLQEYHDLYLLQDVLLLEDVITAFRTVCLNAYGLDPLHYHTAPALTWDAGLKYTKVELELFTENDVDKFLFVENGIRGGISMASHRYAKANHPDYKDCGYWDGGRTPRQQLLYLDAVNLYGFAMMEYLPFGGFEWENLMDYVKYEELMSGGDYNRIVSDWILSIPADSDVGFLFEIDCRIPDNKHKFFCDYPLAPERKVVSGQDLSSYQRDILRQNIIDASNEEFLSEDRIDDEIESYVSAKKLILDLNKKEKYIVHYRNLQLYLKLGLQVTNIHRVLKFKQKPWLAQYIIFNTEMRKRAVNEFEKSFFKLMNNAFFGKTMENVRKRRQIDLVNTSDKMVALTSQPTYQRITKFREDLSAVERIQRTVTLNKPIYVGLCVLELSKWLMYDFYYNVLGQIFSPERIRLLFTDTDSLCISIKGYDNIYDTLAQSIIHDHNYPGERTSALSYFDMSEYSSNHRIWKGMCEPGISDMKLVNKKVPGKMKDELAGHPLLEVTALASKCYAYIKLVPIKEGNPQTHIVEIKKLKGTQKCVVECDIQFDHYKSSLLRGVTYVASQCSLRSQKHTIRTQMIRKVATGPFDDKRYLFADGINSLPYGHYQLALVDNVQNRLADELDIDELTGASQLRRACSELRDALGLDDYDRPPLLKDVSDVEALIYRVVYNRQVMSRCICSNNQQ